VTFPGKFEGAGGTKVKSFVQIHKYPILVSKKKNLIPFFELFYN